MKICICFLTTNLHHFNLHTLYEQAESSLKHDITVYEYVDDEKYFIDGKTVHFSYDILRENFHYPYVFYNGDSDVKDKAGIQFLPFFDMYFNHRGEYDFYLFYEDDVCYFGNVNLFDSIDFDCDFLFQCKRKTVSDEPWWFWFDKGYKIEGEKYFGLLNIYGGTDESLGHILEYVEGKGNYGHHELLISSCILNNVEYMINYIDEYIPSYMTFMYDEEKLLSHVSGLMHPVKTKDVYDKIRNAVCKRT